MIGVKGKRFTQGNADVEALREKGYLVSVTHDRPEDPETLAPALHGGTTTVSVATGTRDAPHVLFETQAMCNPHDRFDRRLGLTIAAGRARKYVETQVEG